MNTCSKCRHFDKGFGGTGYGVCRAPTPFWVESFPVLKESVGENCQAFSAIKLSRSDVKEMLNGLAPVVKCAVREGVTTWEELHEEFPHLYDKYCGRVMGLMPDVDHHRSPWSTASNLQVSSDLHWARDSIPYDQRPHGCDRTIFVLPVGVTGSIEPHPEDNTRYVEVLKLRGKWLCYYDYDWRAGHHRWFFDSNSDEDYE